ncbi:hypothetical protein GCM10023084_27930 [Streptomyces lacrimifluminis]|uniref:Uncharacterized protein n=1 Tax=Streptomyces lacrimifluminis TaxID=1500077 RepID=A0A917KUI6_9ACTN|nr:hypothetical protein [Streptomyces lacrimifluminis]GGJ27102.1 hypothetical protein GCM10012282_24550 [Streptomyces lacrimifluminis]
MTSYALWAGTSVSALDAADHLLLGLAAELGLPEAAFGCTHFLRGDRPRMALSLTLPSEPLLRTAEERLRAQGYEVTPGVPDAVGRAVVYPGFGSLTGTVRVGELLARSAIDRVTVLGTPGQPDPRQRLVTRDHVRPQWHGGELVLAAMPAVGGTLVPFEVPDPTPCCADH